MIHGASGGVRLAAAPIAAMRGAGVITTGRSVNKLAGLEELVYETALADDGLRDRLLAITGGRGADVVLHPVGGDLLTLSIWVLAPYGRLLIIGFTSGDFGTARSNIILNKAISVIGANNGH